VPDLAIETERWDQGDSIVVGIDEAGRGPLAGPVSCAAVVLPRYFSHPLLNDSKKLTEKRREKIYEELLSDERILWAHSYAQVREIDEINILKATHAAMARSVEGLVEKYGLIIDFCLIDGLRVPNFPYPSEGIVKGDGLSLSIAAASVIAKVMRDHEMIQLAEEFPEYGFEKHKGYGTKAHLEALRTHGPTRIHRQSFQPVAQLSLSFGE